MKHTGVHISLLVSLPMHLPGKCHRSSGCTTRVTSLVYAKQGERCNRESKDHNQPNMLQI